MNLEDLSAKEELLELQLKLIRLEKKKLNFIRDQDYEKAVLIQKQKENHKAYLEQQILKYRQFLNTNSVVEHTDLLWIVASLEVNYQNLILENELSRKKDHLKESQTITIKNASKNNGKIEIARQKNQLLQLFIQGELLLKQWTEYYHFQKELLSSSEYIDLVKLRYQSLDLFPELMSVHCFYGDGKELNNQVKAKFRNRLPMFDPILKVLIQFGSKASSKLPILNEEEIIGSLQHVFSNAELYIDGQYKNVNNAGKTFLYITIKLDFSPLNIIGPF